MTLKALSIAAFIALTNTVSAAEVETYAYGSMSYHENQELTGVGLAGMILGFISLGVLMIYALTTITMDQIRTHKLYNAQLVDALAQIQKLGMSQQEVDQQYELANSKKKGKGEKEEQADQDGMQEDHQN
eukprot:403371685